MFSELPKLFDRDFAIGFFLPASVLGGEVWSLLSTFSLLANRPTLETLSAAAIAVAIIWLLAVALLALNYSILRCFEGYPHQLPNWHPLKLRQTVWRQRFLRDAERYLALRRQMDASGDRRLPPEAPNDFSTRLRLAVENYPNEISNVLPTRFGNAFRSLEVYSVVIYGLDAIPAWPRLQAVMPEQFRRQLGEAKSLLDFFINISFGAILSAIIYIILAIWERQLPRFYLPIAALGISIASYQASIGAVRQYGTQVKAAFDLYRGELAKQLGLELPSSLGEEQKMWLAFSAMMIYRSRTYAYDLDRFRVRPGTGSTLPSIHEGD